MDVATCHSFHRQLLNCKQPLVSIHVHVVHSLLRQSQATSCLKFLRLVQLVGPVLAEPAKQLPKDLSIFLEQSSASNQGTVYVSMGSAARLAEPQLRSMAQGLSALSHPVLWKLARDDLPGARVCSDSTRSLYDFLL